MVDVALMSPIPMAIALVAGFLVGWKYAQSLASALLRVRAARPSLFRRLP